MTVNVERRAIPAEEEVIITSQVIGARKYEARIRANGTVRITNPFYATFHAPELDALIEMLHAIKNSAADTAAGVQRLIEANAPHEEIIAVEEPTA